MLKISIGADHAGFSLKQVLKGYLQDHGYVVEDFGCVDSQAVDYPDPGFATAENVAAGKSDFGILICATGLGMCMVANKVKGVRAGLCNSIETARLTRQHNDANVLCLSSKFSTKEEIIDLVNVFLSEKFSNDERHVRRVNKIINYENKNK